MPRDAPGERLACMSVITEWLRLLLTFQCMMAAFSSIGAVLSPLMAITIQRFTLPNSTSGSRLFAPLDFSPMRCFESVGEQVLGVGNLI